MLRCFFCRSQYVGMFCLSLKICCGCLFVAQNMLRCFVCRSKYVAMFCLSLKICYGVCFVVHNMLECFVCRSKYVVVFCLSLQADSERPPGNARRLDHEPAPRHDRITAAGTWITLAVALQHKGRYLKYAATPGATTSYWGSGQPNEMRNTLQESSMDTPADQDTTAERGQETRASGTMLAATCPALRQTRATQKQHGHRHPTDQDTTAGRGPLPSNGSSERPTTSHTANQSKRPTTHRGETAMRRPRRHAKQAAGKNAEKVAATHCQPEHPTNSGSHRHRQVRQKERNATQRPWGHHAGHRVPPQCSGCALLEGGGGECDNPPHFQARAINPNEESKAARASRKGPNDAARQKYYVPLFLNIFFSKKAEHNILRSTDLRKNLSTGVVHG